jgi:hypothetical protein
MKTSASEHLGHAQVMSRLSATFSALIREQIEVVRRFLDSEPAELESSEMGPLVDLAVRLVERSAEWLELTEVANLALELRETLAQLGQLRPAQRQEMIAHCRVALETEEKLEEKLRAEGFGTLLNHAGLVGEAIDQLRSGINRAKAQAFSASRGVIDDATPDVGPHENLLGLTFEIKSALVHQNERIASMSETLGGALHAVSEVLSGWEGVVKSVERRRVASDTEPPCEELGGGKALAIHQTLQEAVSGLRTLSHEMNQLLGIQYSLERRARDLDEHLLWEFLDPLDRFVDEMYASVSRRGGGQRPTVLTVHTGGVGFEPEIGSILLPLLLRLLESAEPRVGDDGIPELRVTAAREGLEARLAVQGYYTPDVAVLAMLESALEGLGGFVEVHGKQSEETSLRMQFPMARSLRSFLIVEDAGQRIAIPWSAIERVHASREELAWSGGNVERPIHSLAAALGGGEASGDTAADAVPAGNAASQNGGLRGAGGGRPVAVLRCGGRSVLVCFDRIVWRENARLTALPERLCPLEEVLGGIVSADGNVILVVHPGALIQRLADSAPRGEAGE